MSRALGIGELPHIGPAVLAMGVFDGVHLGHRSMLEAAREAAAQRGCASVVLVFDPHPEEVLRPGVAVPYLAPLDVNLERIRALGIDHALPMRFDTQLRELSAEAFLDALGRSLTLRGLVMSPESAFGRDRGGTVERMRQLGAERGFEVISVAPASVDGAVVSSSRVRDAIAAGDLGAARRLGASACVAGTAAVPGAAGEADLALDYLPVLPPPGIYAARLWGGDEPPGAARIQIGLDAAGRARVTLRPIGEATRSVPGPVVLEPVTRLQLDPSADPDEADRAALAELARA